MFTGRGRDLFPTFRVQMLLYLMYVMHVKTVTGNTATGQTTRFVQNHVSQIGTSDQVIDGDTTDSNCASVTGHNPWWEIQFGENRTVRWIKIFWSSADIPEHVVIVTVQGRTCYSHGENSHIILPREFNFSCNTPEPHRGDRVTIYHQTTGQDTISLTICEFEIYDITTETTIASAGTKATTTTIETLSSASATDTTPSSTTTETATPQSTTVVLETETADSGSTVPTTVIIVVCVVTVVVLVVGILVLVLRFRGYTCLKSNNVDKPAQPYYAGLEPKTDDSYTTLSPPTYQNERGSGIYENVEFQLEGRHTYINHVHNTDHHD